MRLKIKYQPGTLDFPELKESIPVVGEIRDFPEPLASRLLAANVAVEVAVVKAVATPPEITAPLAIVAEAQPSRPAPLSRYRKKADSDE